MQKRQSGTMSPEYTGVKKIPTESLEPNPHNPRMLFDKEPLIVLRNSIGKVGILVPLTVYWDDDRESFVILDGQRRWICAKELDMESVPVNVVAKPTLAQNIVTMFQIHKLREDWELMPTALKLEVLMNELDERNEKRLSGLTGLDQAVVSRCKKLLSYPKKYQDLMLDPNPEKRVKADFFIELYPVRNDRLVVKMDWYSKEEFTNKMLTKYRTKASGLKAVTDFRIMKQYVNIARRAGEERKISSKLREFTVDDSLTLDHLAIRSADIFTSARKLLNDIKKIKDDIKQIDTEEYYGEEELWKSLEELIKLIRSKLSAVGRRLKF